MKNRTYTAMLSDEQHALFKYHCSKDNTSIGEKVAQLIIEYLNKKNPLEK